MGDKNPLLGGDGTDDASLVAALASSLDQFAGGGSSTIATTQPAQPGTSNWTQQQLKQHQQQLARAQQTRSAGPGVPAASQESRFAAKLTQFVRFVDAMKRKLPQDQQTAVGQLNAHFVNTVTTGQPMKVEDYFRGLQERIGKEKVSVIVAQFNRLGQQQLRMQQAAQQKQKQDQASSQAQAAAQAQSAALAAAQAQAAAKAAQLRLAQQQEQKAKERKDTDAQMLQLRMQAQQRAELQRQAAQPTKRVKTEGGERGVRSLGGTPVDEMAVRRKVCRIAQQHNMLVTTEFCQLAALALSERLLDCAERMAQMARHRRQQLEKSEEEKESSAADAMEIVRKLQEEAARRGKITGRDAYLLVQQDWNLASDSRATARYQHVVERQ